MWRGLVWQPSSSGWRTQASGRLLSTSVGASNSAARWRPSRRERGDQLVFTYRSNGSVAAALAAETQATAIQLDLTSVSDTARAVAAFSELHTVVYAAGPHVPMTHLSAVAPEQLALQLAQDTV